MTLMQKRQRYALFLSFSVLTACNPATSPIKPQPSPIPSQATVQPSQDPIKPSPEATINPQPALPSAVPTAELRVQTLSTEELAQVKDSGLVEANNRFALNIFNTIRKESPKENLLLSPASVSLAFFMAYHAASPEAASEMARVLEIESLSETQLMQSSELLMRKLVKPASDITLEVANSLWVDNSDGIANIEPDYLANMQKKYQSTVQDDDFTQDAFLDHINGWVAKQTHDKITTILDTVPPKETFMYLLNAIYFKASWKSRFEDFETHDRDFHYLNGSTKKVKMMRQFNTFRYFSPQDDYPFQAIELPYGKEGKVSMYLFLPSYDKSLESLYQTLNNPEKLDFVLSHSYGEAGQLVFPKFKMEHNQDLIKPLQSMGLFKVFDPNLYNLPKLTNRDVSSISEAFQKSFIDVNEEGTEAAAVTVIGAISQPSSQPTSFYMVVDKPFFYLMRDNDTGQILFMGQVTDPQS